MLCCETGENIGLLTVQHPWQVLLVVRGLPQDLWGREKLGKDQIDIMALKPISGPEDPAERRVCPLCRA